jgi:hypothetical protein
MRVIGRPCWTRSRGVSSSPSTSGAIVTGTARRATRPNEAYRSSAGSTGNLPARIPLSQQEGTREGLDLPSEVSLARPLADQLATSGRGPVGLTRLRWRAPFGGPSEKADHPGQPPGQLAATWAALAVSLCRGGWKQAGYLAAVHSPGEPVYLGRPGRLGEAPQQFADGGAALRVSFPPE